MKFKKRGQAQVGALVGGIIGLIFLVIVGFVSLDILTGSGLLTADSASANVSDNLVTNLTVGVQTVSNKIPVMFTIAAAVILLGLIVFLVIRARQAQQVQGNSI